MKKKNIKSLSLNKNSISQFDSTKIKVGGGTVNQTCIANTLRPNNCQICNIQ